MKRQFLLTRMLLLFALIVGSGSNVWADTAGLTFTGKPSTVTNGTSTSGTLTGTQSESWSWASTHSTSSPYHGTLNGAWQIGKNGDNCTSLSFSTSGITGTITSIVVRCSSYAGAKVSAKVNDVAFGTQNQTTTNSLSNYTFSGSATGNISITFTNTSRYIAIKSITVTYSTGSSPTTVSTPSFLPDGGSTYNTQQSVTLSCATEGATIHYTMTEDGTTPEDPTESDATYSTAISVTKSGTKIKAKAFKADMDPSSVASATYTIKPNQPTISAAGATVTITGDEGCTLYYTIDGTDPDNTKTEYTAPFDLDADCTIKAKAYDTYGNASDMKSLTFKYMPLAPKNINSGYFEKVTAASTLENGDAILIVNEDANVAMSTTQNNNNRGQTTVTISGSVIYAPSVNVQRLILVKKKEKINETDTDVFYFYTGSDGYLYAAGANSNNYLKTEVTPDNNNNARATISIENGDATIHFTGTASRKWLKYNGTNDLFSCYKADDTDQSIVQIYKEVTHNESVTISSAKYATLCSDKALDFSGTAITAYTATDGATKVTLNEITSGKVPANTPVVLHNADANGTPINVPVIASADAVGDNDLAVVTDEEGKVGVANMFVLSKPAGKEVGFYPWEVDVILNKGKVYLQGKASYGSRSFLGFDDETTGIEAVDVNTESANVAREYYNLNGQRVANPSKGLYIVNGKKVIIK